MTAMSELHVMLRVRLDHGTGGGIQMRGSEDYRHYAVRCLELAGTLHDPKARAVLAHMAQVWLRLADEKDDAKDYGTMSKTTV